MCIPSLVVIPSIIIVVRLLTYQRRGSGYSRSKSILAYLIIFSFGAQAIDVMFNAASVTWAQAGISIGLAYLVMKSHGNVAALLRSKAA